VRGVKKRAKRNDGEEGVGVEARDRLSRACDSAIPLSYRREVISVKLPSRRRRDSSIVRVIRRFPLPTRREVVSVNLLSSRRRCLALGRRDEGTNA
jgi:hypothetical protein